MDEFTRKFNTSEDREVQTHYILSAVYDALKENGKITINGVVGTLVVTEVKTLPGYSIDEATRTQTVDVRPNDTQTLHFTNTPSTTLVIEKYIEGTTTTPLMVILPFLSVK